MRGRLLAKLLILQGCALTLLGCAEQSAITQDVGGVIYTFSKETGLVGERSARTGGAAIADFDGDGNGDILFVNGRHWNEDNLLLLNTGVGTAFKTQNAGAAPNTGYRACPADFDKDGDIDALIARDGPPPVIYRNPGNGNLSDAVEVGRPTASRDCTLADLNGDGALDAILSERGGQSYALLGPLLDAEPEMITLLRGPTVGVAAGDVTGDGRPDVVFSLRGEASVALMRQSADGSFSSFDTFGTDEDGSRAVAVADLDGDGTGEIVMAGLTMPSKVLRWHDDALIADHVFSDVQNATAVAIADVNDDGRLDIVFGTRKRNKAAIANDNGYEIVDLPGISADTYDLALGDLNGDGLPDIVFANSRARNEILLSQHTD